MLSPNVKDVEAFEYVGGAGAVAADFTQIGWVWPGADISLGKKRC